MPIEIKGNHLRVRVREPISNAIYRTDDIGSPHHTKRITMYNPYTKRWATQSMIFPITDVKSRRYETMQNLTKLGVKEEALRLVR